jgi:hypothetical protein
MLNLVSTAERQPGTYARQRYQAGLRRYRSRMRPYWIGPLLLAAVSFTALQLIVGLQFWSFLAGLIIGACITLAVWIHDEPPELIAKWGRGAEGETKTAEAIKPLQTQGWQVRHDIQLTHGNADHLLRSPAGHVYLLETKTLAGTITLEHGHIVCRYHDDPDTPRRHDLRPTLARTTKQVAEKWSYHTGRTAPTIHPIVVIWGLFNGRTAHDHGIHYVAGENLAGLLRELEQHQPDATRPLSAIQDAATPNRAHRTGPLPADAPRTHTGPLEDVDERPRSTKLD